MTTLNTFLLALARAEGATFEEKVRYLIVHEKCDSRFGARLMRLAQQFDLCIQPLHFMEAIAHVKGPE